MPPASEFGVPGVGSNHMMPLFMVMPVLPDTKREPNDDSSVCVTAAMLPSRSTTEKCVVQAGASASAPSERLPSWSPMSFSRSRYAACSAEA